MRILRLSLPILFLVFGVGILVGWIFPGLPEGTGMRPMLGLVTILFGLYRGSVFLFAPPEKRRPYGGRRRKFLGRENETSTGNHESKSV